VWLQWWLIVLLAEKKINPQLAALFDEELSLALNYYLPGKNSKSKLAFSPPWLLAAWPQVH
jgi:hypothetical protein